MSEARKLLYANDIRFIEVARGRSDRDWSRPSLCTRWSNHEVLANLVFGYRASLVALSAGMLRHRGSFHGANAAFAAQLAARHNPAELIDEFAVLMGHPRGLGRVFPPRLLLGDHVIHELDIAFAIGSTPTVATEALIAVLNTQVRVPNPFVPAAARARGLQLHATDIEWTSGASGLTVAGEAAQLASVLAGRPWALDQLTGEGVAELRTRL